MFWRLFLSIIFTVALVLSCTNFDYRAEVKRFRESTNGSLADPADYDAPGADDFAFAAFGDAHYGMGDRTIEIITAGMNGIEGDADIDFYMALGDSTNTGRKHQYDGLVSLFDSITAKPRYMVLGNHDIFFNGWTYFKERFGAANYNFVVDHVTFIVVDSANSSIHKGQFEWLQNQLETLSNDVVVVAMHVPAYTGTEGHFLLLDDPEQSFRFMTMMREYNVDLVLQAHVHDFGDISIGGVRYVLTGNFNEDLDGGEHHYVKVGVSGAAITVTQVTFSP